MSFASRYSQKGSLILLVMCLLAVLGIALAGYLAVSNQSMLLSNRAYATDVSRHLAEMGLERALRSYQANTFSSWTLSGNTAKETLTISSSPSLPTSYGNSGIVPRVNIRVDNYRTTNKAVPWSALTTYAVNDYVWYQGVWYICKSAPPANQDPSNTTYWTAAPAPWSATANYRPGNIAVFGGSAYRCILANVNSTPPNSTYWTSYAAATWSSATTYSVDDVVFFGGLSYRCISASTANSPPNTSYWLSAPVIYSEGVVTLPDSAGTTIKTQLRALVEPAALFSNALGATTYTNLASNGTVDSYNSVLGTYASQVATATNYSAVLAGGNTSSTAVSIGTTTVKGYVAAPGASTSPYDPRWNSVGGASLTGSAATGVDLSRVSRSPYVPQFDVLAVTGGTNINGTGYLADGPTTLGSAGATSPAIFNILGTYDSGTLTLRSGLYLDDSADILTIDGPVILNVTGTLRTNNGRIIISSTGSLEVYFTGALYVGNQTSTGGGIINQSPSSTNPDPKKVLLVGTNSSNTSGINYFWSALDFHGLIYMPNAYVHMWNDPSWPDYASTQRYGAINAKNIYFNHAANLHYDTSLRTAGAVGTFIDRPYLISEWRELTDPTEKVTMP